MKISIIAVGLQMPIWIKLACEDYLKRFPAELKPELKIIRTQTRNNNSIQNILDIEAKKIQSLINKNEFLIVLDEKGKSLTTEKLAFSLKDWQIKYSKIVFIIGGPNGLSKELKNQASLIIKLSDLTLPHALVRVLLLEQLYRAWTININHPYHRK